MCGRAVVEECACAVRVECVCRSTCAGVRGRGVADEARWRHPKAVLSTELPEGPWWEGEPL